MSLHLSHMEVLSTHEAERQTTSFRLNFFHEATVGNGYGQADGQFINPTDVKICLDHHLVLVCDSGNKRVQAFDLFTREFKYKIDLPDAPRCLAIDPKDDSLLITCENCIYKYDLHTHQQVWILGPNQDEHNKFENLKGVVVEEGSGNIYVSDNRIKVLSRNGQVIKTIGVEGKGPMQFNHPHGICFNDRDGFLIVSDVQNNRVQIISKNGDDFIYMFGKKGISSSDFLYPTGIIVDKPTGNILVCDTSNHRIQVFSSRGEFIKSFGNKGSNHQEFSSPTGICINSRNGELYVADSMNHRVQIYK